MQKTNTPFYLLALSLFGAMAITTWSDGMFCDGLMYAAISKNLAEGIGSFWYLQLSNTIFPNFHEHPPLMFFFQSLFFKIFGSSLYIERIFSFTSIVLSLFLTLSIWKEITKKEHHADAWLPILLLVTIPLIPWAAANNMLENLMMVFTTLATLLILKSRKNHRFLYLFISGILIFCAFLSKGFTALYIYSLLFWLWVFLRKNSFSKMVIDTLIVFASSLIPLLIIFLFYKEGIESLQIYFNKQVVGSIESIQTVKFRIYILQRVFEEIATIIFLVSALYFIARKQKFKFNKLKEYKNEALVMLVLAYSGIIPIMISMKQSGFYILSTFPYISLAIALFIVPFTHSLIQKVNPKSLAWKIFSATSIFIFVSVIIASFIHAGGMGRDQSRLPDIYKICNHIQNEETISIQDDLNDDWSLHGYFIRLDKIHLDTTDDMHRYFLARQSFTEVDSSIYTKIDIGLNYYNLFERK